MKLRRLTLHGFKSFADRTEFDFGDGLTGIIGPNGCGKSNVVDAMKWVLGDQRPTSQRGKEMLDVVFHGAEGRPAMGHCEVMLTLERDPSEIGEDGDQPVELSIGRRLFRSGESDYLLNGGVVRLKDIREALLDTGLGVGGYSVMEQGRIDAVLSQNPEERRNIFDEAAGISRYKLRRKEALRKLDKTELNLARVKDLRQEKASRVRSLKIQATRAKSYRETAERLRAIDVALAFVESTRLRAALAGADADFERAERRVRELEARKEQARAELFEVEDAARALAQRHSELRDLVASQRAEERSRREALESSVARITRLHEASERARSEAAAARETLARNSTELEQLVQREAELKDGLAAVAGELPERAREAQGARKALRDAHDRRERVRTTLLEAMHDRTRARNRVRDEELHGHALAARATRLTAQLGELERKAGESERERLVESRVLEDVVERRARVARRIGEQYEARAALAREHEAASRRGQTLASDRSAAASQLELLVDLEASHTGLDEAARALIADGHAIAGRLVEGIECSSEVGPAVEAVLGARLEALLVSDFGRARQALDGLAERTGGGRLVLVDLARATAGSGGATGDGGHERGALPAVEALPASGAPLVRFCRLGGPARSLLAELLDEVVLVRDLDAARAVIDAAPAGARRVVVTLRGELLDGAWITGGVAEAAAGLLQRRNEIERLRGAIVALDTQLDAVAAEQQVLGASLARRDAQIERLERLAEALVRRETALEHTLHARRARERELSEEIEVAAAERREVAEQRSDALSRMMAPLLDTMLLERREARLESEQRGLDACVRDEDRRVHETQQLLSEMQLRRAALEAEANGLGERRALLERSIEELRARCASLEESGARSVEDRARLTRQVVTLRAELVDFACRARFTEELTASAGSELAELETATAAERQRAAEVDGELDAAREARANTQLAKNENTLRLQQVDDRVYDAYQVELARMRGEIEGRGLWAEDEIQGPPLPPDGVVRDEVLAGSIQGPPLPPDFYQTERTLPRLWEEPDFDRVAVGREVEVLKARLARMGAVNLGAEEELENVLDEFEQLEKDCVDLEQARRELMETLHRINVESRLLFERTFEAARQNFQDIFRKLFQGGRADIQLVESDDPLDAGIEIFARPPGKELRSIRLLSGGERSLTALAILFAVFRIKPSPFCILDEVDAALDEANVERFLRVLGDFVGETQFLVVTHHKRTMMECKVLYGVTMPRRGISTRMSVSLEQVESGEVDKIVELPQGPGASRAAPRATRSQLPRIASATPAAEPSEN